LASASDVPNKYDVVINGKGYILAETENPLYSRTKYGYTRTFVERQNTQGAFGDQFQDFWLTCSQNDWSLGEQQKYARVNQDDSPRRFWQGSAVDVQTPGDVSMRKAVRSLTFAAAVHGVVNRGSTQNEEIAVASTTNVYTVTADGTITDRGAHGLGVAPANFGMASDGADVFISSSAGGTVGVRRMDGTYTFSTFSATGSDELVYANNTLYGLRVASLTGNLIRYDTAGAATTLATWQSANGTALSATASRLRGLGGKILILRSGFMAQGPELWLYDGVGVSRIAQLPSSTFAYSLEVLNGIAFIGAGYVRNASPSVAVRPVIFYYANGNIGVLWEANDYASFSTAVTTHGIPTMSHFEKGLVFTDDTAGKFMFYNPATGGVHSIGSYTVANDLPQLGSAMSFFVHTRNATAAYQYPTPTTTATTATLTSSLFDFDSSLDKLFRGIKVDFDVATDGNGGTVDIAYRVGDVDGSYTSLQTGATSGTEYTLTGITGRSISVKVTLNKGTSTNGPVLKRVSVRAAPKQLAFQMGTLLLQCTGKDGEQPLKLRDGTFEGRDGLTMATDLRSVATSGTPVQMTNEFGTISNVVFENDGFELLHVRSNEFIATVPWREV
jgi:hypothetical protein